MLCLPDSIREDDPSLPWLLRTVEDAPSLTALLLATWQVARVLAVHLFAAVLAERVRQPTPWPPCPVWEVSLRSKGLAPRQMMSLFGPIQWQRRVGRCPRGCAIPQVAPLDAALEVQPHQRMRGELQSLGCALAVFVPFATAARLLGWYCGSVVSPRAMWSWRQAAGPKPWSTSRVTFRLDHPHRIRLHRQEIHNDHVVQAVIGEIYGVTNRPRPSLTSTLSPRG
jgi:hypothetical protein